MKKESIIDESGIKRCFISGARQSVYGTLHQHHIINGPLRDWAENEGLWVYLTPELHRWIHDTGLGAQVQKNLLKRIAEYAFILQQMPEEEVEKARKKWFEKVRKHYI